jgi:hypothetical protein
MAVMKVQFGSQARGAAVAPLPVGSCLSLNDHFVTVADRLAACVITAEG